MKGVWILSGIAYLCVVLWLLPEVNDILMFSAVVAGLAALIRFVNLPDDYHKRSKGDYF